MIKISLVAACLLVASSFTPASYAGIVDTGNDSFIHEETGLEWIDFGITNNQSFNDVEAQLDSTYSGWRLPTYDEVKALWSGIFDQPGWGWRQVGAGEDYQTDSISGGSPWLPLIDIIGFNVTNTENTKFNITGLFDTGDSQLGNVSVVAFEADSGFFGANAQLHYAGHPRNHGREQVAASISTMLVKTATTSEPSSINPSEARLLNQLERLLITEAFVDDEKSGVLIIRGKHLCANRKELKPNVSLGDPRKELVQIHCNSAEDWGVDYDEINAILPPDTTPGSILLLVRKKLNFDKFALTIGAVGPEGPQGVAGADGAAGRQGVAGVAGVDGAAGPHGLPGKKGDKGDQGPSGKDGLAGAPGNTFAGTCSNGQYLVGIDAEGQLVCETFQDLDNDGFTRFIGDCNDGDRRVNRTIESFYEVPHTMEDGETLSFDFNCDGREEKQYPRHVISGYENDCNTVDREGVCYDDGEQYEKWDVDSEGNDTIPQCGERRTSTLYTCRTLFLSCFKETVNWSRNQPCR